MLIQKLCQRSRRGLEPGKTATLLVFLTLNLAPACDSNPSETGPADAALPPSCESNHRPIVMAHGFLASGDTWALQALRFQSNGYCPDQLHTFDYNSLDRSTDHVGALDAFVDGVLAASGTSQVDLAGHSQGGALSYDYLSDPIRAAKVARYAHVGSLPQDGPAGPNGEVPTLNIWTVDDYVIQDASNIPGADNLMIPGKDHYAVATCPEAFVALYAHFNEATPPITDAITPQTAGVILLSGQAVSLGENTPAAGWTVDLYAVHSDTGVRQTQAPLASYLVAPDGWWGHFPAEPETHYELHVRPGEAGTEEDVAVHYYLEPFVRTNRHVYLRTLPSPNSLPGLLLGDVKYSEDAAVLVNFTASTAILHGVDSLTVNSVELATADLAPAEDTTIAMFLYDDNSNGTSDETPIPIFGSIPFLNGMDLFLPATDDTITVQFNGRQLNVPPWPSATQGVIITVFD